MKPPIGISRIGAILLLSSVLHAQTSTSNQTVPGPGNGLAAKTALNSPLVTSANDFIDGQISLLKDNNLRVQTYDGLVNPKTCIQHRANLTQSKKQAIVAQLLAQGLLDPADDATFPGGLINGVFPPVLNDGTHCPQLPQPFYAAPGSGNGSHHANPGGLAVHEANADTADMNLADQYRSVYGYTDKATRNAVLNVEGIYNSTPAIAERSILKIDQDIVIGAPLWHDWAKTIVFQWNADGTEFQELPIGGNATNGSKTGGHHVLSIAESIKRGFSNAFVIAQASAHSAPTLGNEYKVVNWIRAASIVAQVDPVARGLLVIDSTGAYRLAPLYQLGSIDLLEAGQGNVLVEYIFINLCDGDYTFSIPADQTSNVILAELAPAFGYDPADVANYNNKYRNVVLAQLSAERIDINYAHTGTAGVYVMLQKLRAQGII